MLARAKDWIGFNPLAWLNSIGRMRRRIQEFGAARSAGHHSGDRLRCLVIVSPWLGTSIPWFSLGVGLMLAAEGADVTFAVDDRRFGPNPVRHWFVLRAIRRVMKAIDRDFAVIHLSQVTPAPSDEDSEREIDRLARLNTIWAMRGEIVETGRAGLEAASRAQIAAAYGNIAGVFCAPDWQLMFLPGGVYGTSGIWRRCAEAAGIRVATYDTGGYETVMSAADGLACQLQDVPRAFHMLREHFVDHPAERAAAIAAADDEITKRRQGTDSFESQLKGAGGGSDALNDGILLALNSSWDAAALGPHRVYSGNTEWIVETVRYLLDNTEAPVIVRQHPAERLAFASTSDDYARLLRDRFGSSPRLHFIAAEDPVNSYVLLERVAAVIVHTSTIGIEAAAFGKPVITGSSPYYASLGFVNQAETLADYQALLRSAAQGELAVTDAMREDAKICMYVTQCCNWVFSVFNPSDYKRWSVEPLETWHRQPSIHRMLRSILDNVPVAVLNHSAGATR